MCPKRAVAIVIKKFDEKVYEVTGAKNEMKFGNHI
jgi:hypothetical protein